MYSMLFKQNYIYLLKPSKGFLLGSGQQNTVWVTHRTPSDKDTRLQVCFFRVQFATEGSDGEL